MKRTWLELALVFILLAAIAGLATAYVNHSGWTLFYGDAESHLDIARRVIDSRKPGYDQLGTVWLPLPHALMLPFVSDLGYGGAAWRAPSLPRRVSFRGRFPLRRNAARDAFVRGCSSFTRAAGAQSESFVFASHADDRDGGPGGIDGFAVLHRPVSRNPIVHRGDRRECCKPCRIAGSLRRLVRDPVRRGLFLDCRTEAQVHRRTALFVRSGARPLYWLGHNWWIYSNPLEFFNGYYAPISIYRRALAQNMAPYPGDHDWRAAAVYYPTAVRLFTGWATVAIGILGVAAALFKRIFWPLLFAALPPVFYMWSMHSGGTPIFVPTLWPFSYYNTRYALTALPFLAIAGGCLVLLGPQRFRPWIAAAIVIAATVPWLNHPQPGDWVTWKESQINSVTRRAWTKAAASSLAGFYHSGQGIVTSFGDLTGILRQAGIPLREALYDGDEPAWMVATTRPDLFLHEEWAVAVAGDRVATAIQQSSLKTGPHYHLVKTVKVKGAPVIEIYKRD